MSGGHASKQFQLSADAGSAQRMPERISNRAPFIGVALAFGRARGVIEGVLAAAGVPITFITPPAWKRANSRLHCAPPISRAAALAGLARSGVMRQVARAEILVAEADARTDELLKSLGPLFQKRPAHFSSASCECLAGQNSHLAQVRHSK